MAIFDYPIHPAADIFPMLEDEKLAELAEDIKTNGLVHSIVVKDGVLIDGRNRREACKRIGIEPSVVELDGEPGGLHPVNQHPPSPHEQKPTGDGDRDVVPSTGGKRAREKIGTIPAEKAKGGKIHLVPLSAPAFEILKTLPQFTQGDFIWTARSGKSPISGFSKMKKRIDAKMQNVAPWTYHDLRRTAATLMATPGNCGA